MGTSTCDPPTQGHAHGLIKPTSAWVQCLQANCMMSTHENFFFLNSAFVFVNNIEKYKVRTEMYLKEGVKFNDQSGSESYSIWLTFYKDTVVSYYKTSLLLNGYISLRLEKNGGHFLHLPESSHSRQVRVNSRLLFILLHTSIVLERKKRELIASFSPSLNSAFYCALQRSPKWAETVRDTEHI